MSRSIHNGRMATMPRKWGCQPVKKSPLLSLRHTELSRLMTFSAVSIKCNGERKVNTGAKHAFTITFTLLFTLPHLLTHGFADEKPAATWHSGAKQGDGERAVATPLFHGQTVPSAVPVPWAFAHSRVATARSPSPVPQPSVLRDVIHSAHQEEGNAKPLQ